VIRGTSWIYYQFQQYGKSYQPPSDKLFVLSNMITGSYLPVAVSTQEFFRLHGVVMGNKVNFTLSLAAGWERLAEICFKTSNEKIGKIWKSIIPLYEEDRQNMEKNM